jgi:hypothetical protein
MLEITSHCIGRNPGNINKKLESRKSDIIGEL